jgi:hypothetical protein
VYLSWTVPKVSQQFDHLVAQFAVIEHDLSECDNPEKRRELLKGMLVVIVQLDQLVLNDVNWLDSLLARKSPAGRPLSKAVHL